MTRFALTRLALLTRGAAFWLSARLRWARILRVRNVCVMRLRVRFLSWGTIVMMALPAIRRLHVAALRRRFTS